MGRCGTAVCDPQPSPAQVMHLAARNVPSGSPNAPFKPPPPSPTHPYTPIHPPVCQELAQGLAVQLLHRLLHQAAPLLQRAEDVLQRRRQGGRTGQDGVGCGARRNWGSVCGWVGGWGVGVGRCPVPSKLGSCAGLELLSCRECRTCPISVCARVGVRPNLSKPMSNHS